MSRKRSPTVIPPAPWSYAPSEVAEWQASTAGPKRPGSSGSRKGARVRRFVGRCPTSSEDRLRRRLAALGFEASERPDRLGPFTRFSRATGSDGFLGKMGSIRVHVRLRKGAVLELRATFSPPATFSRASRLIARLGLRDIDGTWK